MDRNTIKALFGWAEANERMLDDIVDIVGEAVRLDRQQQRQQLDEEWAQLRALKIQLEADAAARGLRLPHMEPTQR